MNPIAIIMIPWTFLLLFFIYNEYKVYKKYGWFKYPDVFCGYISGILMNVTLISAIWFDILTSLPLLNFINFVILGILFMILSIAFRGIHSRRLKREIIMLRKKWEQR